VTKAPRLVPVPDVKTARASVRKVTKQLESTITRVSSFTDGERHRRVKDEWSAVESLRHLTFVIDKWLSKIIKRERDPFHPIALRPGRQRTPPVGTFEEACEVLRGRLQTLKAYTGALTEEELGRPIAAGPKTVAGGLAVIFNELNAHDRFINRDLDVIEGDR